MIEEAAEHAASSGELRPAQMDLGRYARLLASSGVWLLAPTWIALNAIIGAWTTQSVFQLVRDNPDASFADQVLMGGFAPTQVSIGLAVALVIFFAGIFVWGGLFRRFRRTSIMAIGVVGGVLMVAAVSAINHSGGWPLLAVVGAALVALAGLFVLAGATPAALGMLADISETHPEDRGAIMGLYSVFLGVGQIIGSVASGTAADWRGIDGLLIVSLAGLVIALVPLYWLRGSEHLSASAHRGRSPRHSPYNRRLMRLSQLFFTSLRDDPADAEMASHRLLVRAGYVRQLGSGIYSLLPLGFRVDAADRADHPRGDGRDRRQEMVMPVVHPADLWRESGRYDEDRPRDGPLQGPRRSRHGPGDDPRGGRHRPRCATSSAATASCR